MYIQYHASKELGIDKRNILSYAVCILHILSTVSFIVDTAGTVTQVSRTCIHNNNFYVDTAQVLSILSPRKSNLFRLQALYYTSTTVSTLCDFISQGILVSLNRYPYLSFSVFMSIFKDLPMLGHMGSQYSCDNYSFNFITRILGSVNKSCPNFSQTLIYCLSYLVSS